MVNRTAFLALILAATPAPAGTWRFFGSGGFEAPRTPANRSSPLNRGNVLLLPMQTNLADAVVFAGMVSDDRRWKGRIKLRGEASDRGPDTGEVGEAFIQFQASGWLDLALGRMIEKWGTGYGWTPTAFVGPARNPTDPNDRRSSYRGVDMFRAGLYVKGTSASIHLLRGGGVALRTYRLIGATDVSIALRRDDDGTHAGMSLSRVAGDALELHAEAARRASVTSALAGGQYTFGDRTNLAVEIHHSTAGLTASQWSRFRDSAARAAPDDLPAMNRSYAPLRMGRTYAFVRTGRPFADGRMDAELIAIANLRDGSAIVRASWNWRVRPGMTIYAIDTEFPAPAGSEMAFLQIGRVTAAGVRFHF